MNALPNIRRTFVAMACTVLALSMGACGNSAADGRATAVQRSADAVAAQAKQDLRDGWEHTARDRDELILQEWRHDHQLSWATPSCR